MASVNDISPAIAAHQEHFTPTDTSEEVPDGTEEVPVEEVPVEEVPDGTEEVPDGTVEEVLEWAGNDPDRRAAALEAERAGQNRKRLIRLLSDA